MKKIGFILIIAFAIMSFNGCIGDVDFDQARDLAINTPIEASVIYIDEPASTFLDDDGIELVTVRDSVYVEIFSDDYMVDNLTKAEFLFEATNTINRAYQADIEFYDDAFNLQHTFSFSVGASPDNQEVVVEYTEIFEGLELEALKNTTNLVLNLTLQPSDDGTQLTETTPGNLKLRSKALLYIDVISP